ncbi:MAG: CehA/McbA family metallohydrolase [Bacteroidales bacterium]|nr:CehA/McbA family metallohydrolase [Bacteroidales bacterium]
MKRIFTFIIGILTGIVLNAQRPSIGGYTVYYGDLHNHSNVSDGSGSPATAYNYAKNIAKLDFFSLTDHSGSITSTEWTDVKNQANAYNQDGIFTAFYGFEWSSFGNYGHVAVINTEDYCATATPTNTFSGLVSWLASRPNGIAFFNHPGREDAIGSEFSHFATAPSNQFVGIELWNKGNGLNVYYYNDGYYTGDNNKSYFDEALSRGWKIGAAGAGDNHSATWGTAYPSRLAILANNLTRANLLAAMQAKRFYTTMDKNIALSFKVNGAEMGSTVVSGANTIQIQASDADNEIFKKVILFDKNHNVVSTWSPNHTTVNISSSLTVRDGDFYYVKVTQTDGNEAISSPIFVSSSSSSNKAPVSSITSPCIGASFIAPGFISIEASAIDADGKIAKVEFYQGSIKLGEDLTSPFSYNWSGVGAGNYYLTVIATDNVGAKTLSSVISISVVQDLSKSCTCH